MSWIEFGLRLFFLVMLSGTFLFGGWVYGYNAGYKAASKRHKGEPV